MPDIIVDVRLLAKGGNSGIEEYTKELLTGIFAQDTKNRYRLFYNAFHKAPLDPSLCKRAEVVVDTRIPNRLLDLSTFFFHAPRVEHFMEGDLVFSPHFNVLATHLPRIVTFHDLSFIHHPYFFSRKQRLWHALQHYRMQAARAQKIIAVSEFTKNDLVTTLGIPKEKISVIYSGVSAAFRKLEPRDPRIIDFKKAQNLNRPFILYLGTIEPRKNIVSLIKAFNALKTNASFKDFELILAGQNGWLFHEVLQEAEHSPYRDSIRFLGAVSSAERAHWYNLASVFVYPSFFEGFGFPPLEAQACGTPVIASDRTSLPEILGDSALLINPWRVDELYFALKNILENNPLREKLVREGRENSGRFTWERAAQETVGCFSDALSGRANH